MVPLLIGLAVVLGFILYKRAGQVSGAEAQKLVSGGALLLDVRTAEEFAQGHIPQAKNVPVRDLAARMPEVGDPGRVVVVYCSAGVRSAVARSMLKSRGFGRVFNLGPMSRW
jgi:phage shock protein E